MIVKSFNLTDDEMATIKELNYKLSALKDLLKEVGAFTPKNVVQTIIDEYSKTKMNYDEWFSEKELEYSVITTPQNNWNVDFKKKELQLIG